MPLCVIGVNSESGIPVFVRKKGNSLNLPFSSIGSLNGCHMFTKLQNIDLIKAQTENSIVLWKEFQNLKLIGIGVEIDESTMDLLLELIFNAIVLCIGLEDLNNQQNIELLKRDLRICFPLIDKLMETIDNVSQNVEIIGLSQCILTNDTHLMLEILDGICDALGSLYGCFTVNGKIIAATKIWWVNLHVYERYLLSLYPQLDTIAAIRDIPIFLPFKTPDVAFRLVICNLFNGIQLSVIGPQPEFHQIEYEIVKYFNKNHIDTLLKSVEQCSLATKRNFPSNVQLDNQILSFLLINSKYEKYVLSFISNNNTKHSIQNINHRLEILKTFYFEAVNKFLIDFSKLSKKYHFNEENIKNDDELNKRQMNDDNSSTKSDETSKNFKIIEEMSKNLKITNNENETDDEDSLCEADETYWCSEYHKCHALKIKQNILCVMYTSNVPTHTMRLITEKTLNTLIFENQIIW